MLAITQAGEDLLLPEPVDLAFCRFLLMHVVDPAVVLARMRRAVRPGGWVVAQEPITSAGRVGGTAALHARRPSSRHRGAPARRSSADAGLEIVDAWAEAPAGVGPGPVADYLGALTGVSTRATTPWCCPRWSRSSGVRPGAEPPTSRSTRR